MAEGVDFAARARNAQGACFNQDRFYFGTLVPNLLPGGTSGWRLFNDTKSPPFSTNSNRIKHFRSFSLD
jgi:hypothetical protein